MKIGIDRSSGMDRTVALCHKCGLPLGFKKIEVRGRFKWCPTNPDGSDHWDLCRETRIASMTPAERAKQARLDLRRGRPKPTAGQVKRPDSSYYDGEEPPW